MNPLSECPYFDSHTGGEPTRVIVSGFPDLGSGSIESKARELAKYPGFLNGTLNEPRGHEAIVGAIIFPSSETGSVDASSNSRADLGVIFYNPAGPLGMCGHGTIGLIHTIRSCPHLGDDVPQWLLSIAEKTQFELETPAGSVQARSHADGRVEIQNVESFRTLASVSVATKRHGTIVGDVAYGGNWFFLVKESPLPVRIENRKELLDATLDMRDSLANSSITGDNGAEIDHVELFGPPLDPAANSKNFVLCPGGAYDRSPCGTGTSAKIACLASDGTLKPGEEWVQESITGSLFTARYEAASSRSIHPTLIGQAHMSGRGRLLFETSDPLKDGIEP